MDCELVKAGYEWTVTPERPYSWNDHLMHGSDAVSQIARLFQAGYLYGAVAIARNQLTRWSLNIAHNAGVPKRQPEEKTEDWLRQVWSAHPSTAIYDGAAAWQALSEWLHGRGRMAAACDTTWTWPRTASDPPRELFRLASGVWEASSIAFSRVRGGVWTLANAVEVGMGAPTRLDFLMTGVGDGEHGEWGVFAEHVDLVDFMLPFTARGDDWVRKAQRYRALIAESASMDPHDLTQEAGLAELALIERRGRAVEKARLAFERERDATGMGRDDLMRGMALLFRLSSIAEAARMASTYASHEAGTALRTAAMALDSATPLWLEDDDAAFICLRGVVEQTAQARTWRTKPGQAARLLAGLQSPSRWMSKAGWGRLNPVLHSLGEFAHVSFDNRTELARERLAAVLPQPETHSRLRGDTLDLVALLLADEVAVRLDEADAQLGAAFRREITLTSSIDHAAALEALLQNAMPPSTRPQPSK